MLSIHTLVLGGWAPSGCMWLIIMVNKSPKDRVVGPLPNGHSWFIDGSDPNHLRNGMVLQIYTPTKFNSSPLKNGWLEDYFPIGKVTFQWRTVKLQVSRLEMLFFNGKTLASWNSCSAERQDLPPKRPISLKCAKCETLKRYWDVLLVLSVHGLFHPYLSIASMGLVYLPTFIIKSIKCR